MRIGLALPQYDLGAPGEPPLEWTAVVAAARRAEALGFDSVWLADLFLDTERYGAGPGRWRCLDPLVALGALARHTSRVRLGTLTLCAPLRPATVLAKSLATIDVLSGGRLVVGLRTEDEPGPAEAGSGGGAPGPPLARLAEAVEVLGGMAGGGPFSFDGRYERVARAYCLPRPVQRPRPPIWLGGHGDPVADLVARAADGWITAWRCTPAAYRQRLAALHAACERHGRDPASIELSVGLYALVGEDGADVARRFERLGELSPPGMLAGVGLDDWRRGGLVGTVDEVREQLGEWAAVGVSTVVVTPAAMPFTAAAEGDSETVAAACSLEPCRTSDPWS